MLLRFISQYIPLGEGVAGSSMGVSRTLLERVVWTYLMNPRWDTCVVR